MAEDKLRILYIRDMLERETDRKHVLSAKQIAERLADQHNFSCDRKTIYKDISRLEEYGMKIGKTGGSHPGYFVEEREFSLPELKLLVDAVQASRFITAEKSRGLIKKLEGLTSRYHAERLQRQVFIYNRVKADNESIFDTVDTLHEAILQNRKVKFLYCRWNMKKQLVPRKSEPYVVSPWSLTWSHENYYLVGVYELEDGSREVRHFRVDKMMETEALDQLREGKKEFSSFDQTAFARKTFSMYGGPTVNVQMKCREDLAGVIIDRFGKETTFFPAEEGSFTVNVDIAVSRQFFGWITGVGDGIRIADPEDVQKEYREYLRGILESYEGDVLAPES